MASKWFREIWTNEMVIRAVWILFTYVFDLESASSDAETLLASN
jgi:hypothetical protein